MKIGKEFLDLDKYRVLRKVYIEFLKNSVKDIGL